VTRPTALPVNEAAIPAVLKALDRWVCWRYEWRDGRWTEMPYRPCGEPAHAHGPATWSSFAEAFAAYQTRRVDGISFALGAHRWR
jgi:putative DNA primase/helicase